MELDWGTNWNESFSQYFVRLEDQIDLCRKNGIKPPIDVIMSIFRSQCYNRVGKLPEVYDLLKKELNREPYTDDLDKMLEYLRKRLEDRATQRSLKASIDELPDGTERKELNKFT